MASDDKTWPEKKYSHEMSKFYCAPNPSGNLRLFLSSHCPNRIDELMNAWPAAWAFRSSHSPCLGRFIKDEGKHGGRDILLVAPVLNGDLTLHLPFHQ